MICVIVFIVFLFSLLLFVDIVVVVSEDNDLFLLKEDVEQFFFGENMFFFDGEFVIVVIQCLRNLEYMRFNIVFFGMSNIVFKLYWLWVIFVGCG